MSFLGISSPNATCEERYFCKGNATSATPNQGNDAGACPVGHYCPEKTGVPENCPPGTFSNETSKIFNNMQHSSGDSKFIASTFYIKFIKIRNLEIPKYVKFYLYTCIYSAIS